MCKCVLLVYFVIVPAILTACGGLATSELSGTQNHDSLATAEQRDIEDSQYSLYSPTIIPEPEPTIIIQEQPNDRTHETSGYKYRIAHTENGSEYDVIVCKDGDEFITVSVYDMNSSPIQSFIVESYYFEEPCFEDVNLDGFLDIVITTGGTLNTAHLLFLWSDSSQSFEQVCYIGFDLLSYFVVHEGYIINWAKETHDSGVMQFLVWEGNTLVLESESKYFPDDGDN